MGYNIYIISRCIVFQDQLMGGGEELLVKKRLVFNRSLICCFLAPSFCPSPISPWRLYILFPLSFSLPSSLISSLSPLPSTYPPPFPLSLPSPLPMSPSIFPYSTLFPFISFCSPCVPLHSSFSCLPSKPPPPPPPPRSSFSPSPLPTNISPSISLLSLSLSLSPALALIL